MDNTSILQQQNDNQIQSNEKLQESQQNNNNANDKKLLSNNPKSLENNKNNIQQIQSQIQQQSISSQSKNENVQVAIQALTKSSRNEIEILKNKIQEYEKLMKSQRELIEEQKNKLAIYKQTCNCNIEYEQKVFQQQQLQAEQLKTIQTMYLLNADQRYENELEKLEKIILYLIQHEFNGEKQLQTTNNIIEEQKTLQIDALTILNTQNKELKIQSFKQQNLIQTYENILQISGLTLEKTNDSNSKSGIEIMIDLYRKIENMEKIISEKDHKIDMIQTQSQILKKIIEEQNQSPLKKPKQNLI